MRCAWCLCAGAVTGRCRCLFVKQEFPFLVFQLLQIVKPSKNWKRDYPVENYPSSRNYRRECSGNVAVSDDRKLYRFDNKLRTVILFILPVMLDIIRVRSDSLSNICISLNNRLHLHLFFCALLEFVEYLFTTGKDFGYHFIAFIGRGF